MYKLLLLTLALMSPALQPLPALVTRSTTDSTFEKLAGMYERLPVGARVDRVWRAIPGLCGWKLNVGESIDETEQAHDHRLHLKWDTVPPPRRLADLPPNPVYRAPRQEKSACLMINVSWGEEYVPMILTRLREAKVHATFFLDGAWVKKHPDLAKDILKDGHAVGSHGTGHPDFRKLSNAGLERQVAGTNLTIRNTLGVEPRLLAPPAGAFDERTVQTARRAHMYTILWTVDSIDWRRPPASAILSRVLQQMEPGALVLLHPTAPTAEALPLLIRSLKERGYHLKTVEEVVDEKPALSPPSTLSG